MTNSIFEEKKSKRTTHKVPVVVPESLYQDVEEVKKLLASKAPDLNFNVNWICVKALERAVKKAKTELKSMA